MGKTQKYSSIISVKTDADFSSLINALSKVQSEMKTKMSGKDALGIEESLDKIKQLQEKLKTIRERGFSSPKDVNDYNRLMDQLIDKATDVQSAFKRIHLTGLDKEVDKLDSDLKKAKNNIKNITNEIGKAVSKATKGNENSADFVTETKKAIEAGKDLQKVQESITQTIQAQITAQKQLVAEQQKRIDSVKYKNSISHVTAQSFTFEESKKSRWKGPDDNKSIMNYVTSSYNKVLENKNITTAASAMTKFIELLDGVGLKFKDNSKAIEKFDQAFTKAYDSEGSILLQANKQLKEQTETLKDLEAQAKNSENIFGTKTVQSLLEQYKNGAISIEELTKKLEQARVEANNKQLPQSINNVGAELNNASKKSQEFQSSLNNISQSQVQFDSVSGSIASFTKRVLSVTTAYHTLRRVIRSTFEDIKNLDKAFGSIAMVTGYSVSDMWQQYSTYAQMANKLGQTTQSVIEASGLYYQQGLETVEVMKLTEDTMKLATLAGLDFKEATSQMTGALRAFHMEMDQGAHVTDVYASLAASAAADVNGISEAMSATAAIAHSAGMSFENTSAMLTTMIEATQEAPKNLGTAMKAIIARFTELKNSVAGTAASEFEDLDYNKVDKALKSVGISIKDTAGQFRNLDDVFLELSGKWDTLDRNTQRYIATIAAGSRQQSRFIALMENYDRTMELIEVANNSANKADKQFAKYSDTVEFKLNRLKNAWEQAKTTVFTSDFFGGLIEGATSFVEKLEKLNWGKLLVIIPAALAAGRVMGKAWIQGFSQGANSFKNFIYKRGNKEGLDPATLQSNYKNNLNGYDVSSLRQYKKQILKPSNEKGNAILDNLNSLSARKEQLKKEVQASEQTLRNSIKDVGQASRNQFINPNQLNKYKFEDANKRYQGAAAEHQQIVANANTEQQNIQNREQQLVQDYKAQKALNDQQLENYENLKKQRSELYKTQKWSAIGQSAGIAVGTALTMGIMGTFSASEIATTIGAQLATTAASQLASGNWVGAIVSGVTSLASFGLKALFDYWDEEEEKRREAINGVYKHEKAIKALEEKQEELNQELDKQNQKYDKTKEKYETFTQAKETYEELTKKIALTEEEQEKLNSATKDLLDLHPELLEGYNAEGQAILNMGKAWDTVAEAEKSYWNQVKKDQLEADIKSTQGELEIAKEYQEKDKALRLQREELFSGREVAEYWDPKWNTLQYKNINDLLDMTIWDSGDNARGDDAERYIQNLIKDNSAFGQVFLEAYNAVMEDNIKSAETAYDKMFNGSSTEENARWTQISEYIKNQFKLWEDLEGTDLSEGTQKNIDALKRASSVTINQIDLLIEDSIENEDAKKQLLAQLQKEAASEETIKKAYDELDNFSLDTFAQNIIDNNQELIEEYSKLTPYQLELIGDFYNNLNEATAEESEKAIQKIKALNVGQHVIEALRKDLTEQTTDNAELELKLEKYMPQYKGSAVEKVFSKLGTKGKKAFINTLASFSDEEGSALANSLETFISDHVEIDSDILQNLMGQDWSNFSIVDFKNAKKEFLSFAEEQGVALEQAEKYWNDYKAFMSNLGILDMAKEEFSGEALLSQLEEELDEKLKAGKISNVIENSLKNGFISFSDSNDFRKACDQIGLKASDYISEGIGGMEQINVDAFEEAIKQQGVNEEEIIQTLRDEYTQKIENLDIQIELLEAQKETTDQIGKAEVIAKKLGSDYKIAAAYAYALSQNLNPEKVELDNQESFVYDINDEEYDSTIAALKEQRNKLTQILEEDLVSGSDFMVSYMARVKSYIYELIKNIEEGKKSATEAYSDLVQAQKDMEAADKALARAKDDLTEKLYQEGKAWKELQKAQYGDRNRVGKLDGLYNYSTALDNISRKASLAKEKLDDLSEGDNIDQLLATYTTEIHNEVVIRGAEDSVIKTAMANTEQQLAQYSEYWDKIGDTYVINIEKLNAASMSDLLKDEIENQVDQLNKWQKTLYDNQDAIDKLRKQFEDDQKKALQSYVNMEKEVINTLKEQYEKQVKDLKDKNEAMKDADDDYLDALEKAIDKERKLRDRQNQWDDLAKKEKKLSLISRDTSGAQQIEAQKLQQEVEKDRTQLLDDTIDDVVDSLKELYELQQESREAEIEYMEAMLDNASLIKEANEIIQNWGSNEDAVNWFLTNKDLTEMSAAEIELEKKNWNDLYEAKILYEKQSKIDFDKYLETTQEEINEKIGNLQTSITDQSAKAFAAVKENIDDAIHSAQQAYNSAKQSYEDQKEAMEKLQMTATAAKEFYDELRKQLAKMSGLDENATPEEIYAALGKQQEQNGNDYGRKAAAEGNARANKSRTTGSDIADIYDTSNSSSHSDPKNSSIIVNSADGPKATLTFNPAPTSEENKVSYLADQIIKEFYGSETGFDYSSGNWGVYQREIPKDFNKDDIDLLFKKLQKQNNKFHGYIDTSGKSKILYMGIGNNAPQPPRPGAENNYNVSYTKFAKGGIVDYTGPAWVDGTPSNPEAFLSVDDTRLIGNLINLLSNIPSLNPNTNPSTIATSNIGDTTVNLTVNFDSVSEDYDAERVIDLMKEKIVEAANYTGANVILNKR